MSVDQTDNRWHVHHGDCRNAMAAMPENGIDSVVTDPPYGLKFMGRGWDHGVPGVEFWEAALRVAKPGAHLLAFGGTRTYHRLATAIEDAGWEIRDCLGWVYGSGFPKSHDVSKALDKLAGAEREVIEKRIHKMGGGATYAQDSWTKQARENGFDASITAPATEEARRWDGWGTALKPAWEPVILARKSLGGTVAANVLEWGTGGINVNGCRVGDAPRVNPGMKSLGVMHDDKWQPRKVSSSVLGRWPANFIHDGSEEATDFLGDAARFFYCAKGRTGDRDEGLGEMPGQIKRGALTDSNWSGEKRFDGKALPVARNHHPCVKPTPLMRYLCRLITPPGGLVFDPFTGSGSTGKAALMEGFRFVGTELDQEYVEIARARIAAASGRPKQLSLEMLDG